MSITFLSHGLAPSQFFVSSEPEGSPGKSLARRHLPATYCVSSSVSSAPMPTRTMSPWPMDDTTAPSTVTDALLTLWMTARMPPLLMLTRWKVVE